MNQNQSHDPSHDHIKVNNTTLTKSEQDALLRSFLPSVNGQEGSPANTFTSSELHQLQRAVGTISIGPSSRSNPSGNRHVRTTGSLMGIRDLQSSFQRTLPPPPPLTTTTKIVSCSQDGMEETVTEEEHKEQLQASSLLLSSTTAALDWYGIPRFHQEAPLARSFREQVRYGHFQGPTNGICPGFLQCNLVVLPQGPLAYDFLLFCQRNPKSCPLIEVCDVGSPFPNGVALGADLRTDVPR
jgi:hypothetical protein